MRLYFVLETKGTINLFGISTPEQLKFKCGRAHFEALENDLIFPHEPVRDWREFRKSI